MGEEEWTALVNKYERAVSGQKELEQILFQAFINLSEHLMFQMNTLNSQLQQLDPASYSEADVQSLTGSLQAFFSRDASMLRTASLFCLAFVSIDVDVTWLDEIAEGLKLVLTAINSALLSMKRVHVDQAPGLDMSKNSFVVFLENVLRQVTYTLGFVAGRLIQQDQGANDDDNTLSRLNVLQGGVEDRFIPGLSEPTKVQIEGSFKITGNKQLQKLALSAPDAVVVMHDDEMLRDIIANADSVRPTLDALHQALLTKVPMCAFARLGGEDGGRISRAAFAVILKFSDSLPDFEGLTNQVARHGQKSAKEVVAALKEAKSAEFESLLKRYEAANQMRKWTQQIRLTTSERVQQEVEQAFREAWNKAHPSEAPLTGQLSEAQKQEVEAQFEAKYQTELKDVYDEVVRKAELLITLQTPAQYKRQKKSNKLMGRLRNQMSLHLQRRVEDETKLHIMIQQAGAKQQKDTEYDWTDRLKQWKKVQQAEGAIADLGAKGQLNSNSVSLAVLGLLQSEYTASQVKTTVEEALVRGLRRSAGLNLINFGMGLHGNPRVFQDVLQWFSASLRNRKNTTVHFLDGLAGCGNSCESGIREQFFKILDKVLLKLKTLDFESGSCPELKLLLENLCWNFKAEDHALLGKLKLFEFLSVGDGSDLCWVNYYQGRYRYHSAIKDESLADVNLGRLLQQTMEYLQNQVLAGVLETDAQAQAIESKQSQAKMIKRQASLDENATLELFKQMATAAWATLERSLKVNRLGAVFEYGGEDEEDRVRHEYNLDRSNDRFPHDLAVYFDCEQRNPEVKTLGGLCDAITARGKRESRKLDMFIRKIEAEERAGGLSEDLETFLLSQVGPALGLRVNISQIIEHIKAQDLKVTALLRRTSFEQLGLEEPAQEQAPEEAKKEEGLQESDVEVAAPAEEEEVDGGNSK